MNKMIRRLALPALLSGMFILGSCVSGDNQNDGNLPDGTDPSTTLQQEQVRKILYTIPTPMSMASIIKQTGATFDKDVMNGIDKISNYNTAKQQALNLGIYGADLSYSSMFDQDQEAIQYLSAVQKLCTSLGIEGAIESDIYKRLNDYKDNRDSVLNIVSETYFSLDIYLKEAGREDLLALIVTGGWVEGLSLAAEHMSGNSPELRQRIAEQKYAVNDLVKLLETYGDNPVLNDVREDVKSVAAIFNEVEINQGKTETSTDENGKLVIGGSSTSNMSDETLNKVMSKIRELRNKYSA
jgi:predicted Zn-ribbon and HTH transcriptional regulator